MISKLYSLFYTDKNLKHPILGKITCVTICEKYQECLQYKVDLPVNHDQCMELQFICNQCYESKDKEEFINWINNQFEEAEKLLDYLQKRKSEIPDQLFHNPYAVFTHPDNVIRYKQFKKAMKSQKQSGAR